MRVLTALVALAALPFAAGMAQGSNPFSDPKNCGAHLNFSDKAAAHRADAALPHGGKHGVMDRPCSSPVPPPVEPPPVVEPPVVEPPPACAVSSLPVSGSLSIVGKVRDAATGTGLAGWCVQLFTDAGSAIVETDASGNYLFANLPDGDYVVLVCEILKDGWLQTFPTVAMGGFPCPVGLGHSFPTGGMNASFVDFRNQKL